MALLDPGDEVLIPAPYWVSYPDMVKLAGGRPVILETKAEDDFAVTAEQVARRVLAAHARDRAQQPVEPDRRGLRRARRSRRSRRSSSRRTCSSISDDIYRQLVYGDAKYVSIAAISPEVAKRTILVDGVSQDVRDDRLAHRLHRVAELRR